MNEAAQLIDLLNKKAKLVAMLAPSFPVVYEYPQIVGMLKNLGFSYIVEVAAGAKKTNEAVLILLQSDPQSRFITSPCPSFVRLVRTKYQRLLPYLALTADSPMVATAKIVKEKYPKYQPVFLGPCIAKKFEAKEDYPDLNILALTYKELDGVFKHFNIAKSAPAPNQTFDIIEKKTRIYPIDGGLTESSGVRSILKDEEIRIVSGWKNCEAALLEFEKNPKIRLLDILFCEGGCIMGPGIASPLSLDDRKKKIMEFSLGDIHN
jgi:iron only hydrogenase large subunit-like protein